MASRKRQSALNPAGADAKKEKKKTKGKPEANKKKISIAAKTVEKWQSHSHATKKFLTGIIETTANYVLAHTNPDIADDVQNHLDMIKHKLYAKFDSTKAPRSAVRDYQKVAQEAILLQESAKQLEQQQEMLRAAILEKEEALNDLRRLARSNGQVHPAFLNEDEEQTSS